MARGTETVHIFVGSCSRPSFIEYLREQRSDPEAMLSSAFSSEFFDGWVDHDFLMAERVVDRASIADLMKELPHYNWFVEDAIVAGQALGVTGGNCVIAAYDDTSRAGLKAGDTAINMALTYLGEFEYSSRSDTGPAPERTDGHAARITHMVSIGEFVYSGDFEGSLRRWRVEGGARILDGVAETGLKGPVQQIRPMPGGVVVCANGVVLWPLDGEAHVFTTLGGYQMLDVAVHPDGQALVVAQVPANVVALALPSGQDSGTGSEAVELGRIQTPGRVWSIGFDGEAVVANDSEGIESRWLIGAAEPFEVATAPTTWRPSVVCGGRRFIADTHVLDDSGAVVLTSRKEVTDLATDGTHIAAVDQDASCKVFTPDGEIVAEYQLEIPEKSINIPTFSKDPWGLYAVTFHASEILVGDGFGRVHLLTR